MADLEQLILRVLARQPHLTAREIAWQLRSHGAAVHKRGLNPLLYRSVSFEQDGGRVPRWRLATQQAARPDLETRIAEKRDQRKRLDERQQQVAALRSGAVAPPGGDGERGDLTAAIALLRKYGVEIGAPPEPAPAPAPAGKAASPRRRSVASQRKPSAARREAAPADPVPLPDWTIESLRPWQREALTAWYDAGCVGICEAVTGTGKTHLGLEAVAQTVRRGGRATVLVPSVLLQRQWELRLEEFVGAAVIAKVGGNARGNPKTADVVLAVVNSAASNDLTDIPGMELLVADEVHRYGGEGWAVALRDGYDRRLGLTATLERSSDDGVAELLLPYFTSVVHHYGYDRATTEGVVAPFDLIFLGVDLDPEQRQEYESLGRRISSARKVLIRAGAKPATLHQQLGALRSMGGDVTKAVIAFENATRERRRLLAETPAKHDAVRSLSEFVRESDGSVVFTQSIETAEAAAHVLREEHLQVEAVSSALTHRRRQELIDGLFDRALDALAAPKILDEGVDVPDVNLGIVMGASSSRRQMIQRLGRIIRLKADGGRARFVVLFVIDSVEDPQSGSRQDFMDEVEDAASRVVLLPEWDEDDLSAVWAGSAPTWSSDMVGAPDDAAPDGALPAPVVVPPQPAGGTPERVAPRPGSAAPRCRRPQRRLPRPVPAAPTAEVLAVLDEIEQTRQLLELLRMEAATQRGPS